MTGTAVSPTDTNPKHHASLSDGTNIIDFVFSDRNGEPQDAAVSRNPVAQTALKTYSGQGTYDDQEFPYIQIAQTDWSGGRGVYSFDSDKSMYYKGKSIDTSNGELILGPLAHYTWGYRNTDFFQFNSYKDIATGVRFYKKAWKGIGWVSLRSTTSYMAIKFTPDASHDKRVLSFWLRTTGAPTGTVKVDLCADGAGGGAGSPGTLIVNLFSRAVDAVNRHIMPTQEIEPFAAQAVVSGTTYWLKFYVSSGTQDATNTIDLATSTTGGGLSYTKSSEAGSTWAAYTSGDIVFRLTDVNSFFTPIYFEYKRALHCVCTYDNYATAPKLYLNGDMGKVTSSTATVVTTTNGSTVTWAADEAIGSIIILRKGTGDDQVQTWREILDNTATSTGTTTFTVADWDVNPGSTTEFTIVNSDKWTEITGHGMTGIVTDVQVFGGLVYFCLGDAVNIRRHRAYNNAGTWTRTWDDDGTNKAGYITHVNQAGTNYAWIGSFGAPANIKKATAVTDVSISNLSFGSAIYVGDTEERITKLKAYDDPEKLFVLKEGSVYKVDNDKPYKLPLGEMAVLRDERNGRAACISDAYLWINMGFRGGAMRYYRQTIENVSINVHENSDDNDDYGYISSMAAFPGGRVYAGVEGLNTYKTSSLYMYENGGYHNMWESGLWSDGITTKQIRSVYLQTIPGVTVDRLWIGTTTDMLWVNVSRDPYFDKDMANEALDTAYHYIPGGIITSGWHFSSWQDVLKTWKSLTVFGENISSNFRIYAQYRTSPSDGWTTISGTFDTTPSEEINFSSATPPNVQSRQIQYRLILQSNNIWKTPRVHATVIKAFGIVPPKYSYSWFCKLTEGDQSLDLQGEDDKTLGSYTTVQSALTQLDSWVASQTPLTMNCAYSVLDGKTVVLQSVPMSGLTLLPEDQVEELVIGMNVVEL